MVVRVAPGEILRIARCGTRGGATTVANQA
jgi:hypothetical protein